MGVSPNLTVYETRDVALGAAVDFLKGGNFDVKVIDLEGLIAEAPDYLRRNI